MPLVNVWKSIINAGDSSGIGWVNARCAKSPQKHLKAKCLKALGLIGLGFASVNEFMNPS